MKHQLYIDPVYVRGNILRAYLLWDWKTRIELKVEFLERKIVSMDRFRIILFVTELMRRSGMDFIMTRDRFVNMQFKEFPGMKITIENMDF